MVHLKQNNMKTILSLCFSFVVILLQAQIAPGNICSDRDCLEEVLNIKLDDPLQPAPSEGYSNERTKHFKEAYLAFQGVKEKYAQNPKWQSKYSASQLGGKNCLRHYQLESYFGNEYIQNPAFKAFIDAQGVDGEQFKQLGFNSSRQGLNLEKRMSSQCPQALKKLDKKQGPNMEGVRIAYDKIGRDLGYFDEKGRPTQNFMAMEQERQNKAKEEQANAKPKKSTPKKLSKKKRIEQMKSQVAQLPTGTATQQKMNEASEDLISAASNLDKLDEDVNNAMSVVDDFLPQSVSLKEIIEDTGDSVDKLSTFKPKSPRPGLSDKLKKLSEQDKAISEEVKDIVNNGKKLKNKHDDTNQKIEETKGDLAAQNKAFEDLKRQLDDLAKTQEGLAEKLDHKPRKIIEELQGGVKDAAEKAEDLSNGLEEEVQEKDKLLEEIDALKKQKQALEDEFAALQKAADALAKKQKVLQEEVASTEKEVEDIQREEAAVGDLNKQLAALPSEPAMKKAISSCEEEMKKVFQSFGPLEETQTALKEKVPSLGPQPNQLLTKNANIASDLQNLTQGKYGAPLTGKTLEKANDLTEKLNATGVRIEALQGNLTRLQDKIGQIDEAVIDAKYAYNDQIQNVSPLQEQLTGFVREKTDLENRLKSAKGDIGDLAVEVNDFAGRFKLFEHAANCATLEKVKEKVGEIEAMQRATDQALETLKKDLNDAAQQETSLVAEVRALELVAEEEAQKAAALQVEETSLKKEFGEDLELQPVSKEEWTKGFEVERPYWKAVYHPDDEMVEGYKGRYFELSLKNASKNATILFPIGKYFMDKNAFNKQYGATLGSFVIEALYHLKNSEAGQVKLFVQGSADAVGSETFRGRMDSRYDYGIVDILPKLEEGERFAGMPEQIEIPASNFRNSHLPDLRASYLKEIISTYTDKFDPVLLEGVVTETEDAKKRNAAIYLFFPDSILADN
ncbi:MAG: hypothetical protein DHS20C18_48530 [Saprospiraceae bacterium]|nr:MAG: hypothetical protein DHS20C18_48530 [Saprospiraceae bacterium]